MKLHELADYLNRLESTSSRIEITKILSELFDHSTKNEIKIIVNMLLGRLAPSYENIVFNLADKMVIRALAEAYDRPLVEIVSEYKKHGDLGTVAQLFAVPSDASVEIKIVFEKLRALAQDEGEGSQERKISSLAELLRSLDPLSARYIARIPVGKLRLGFSDKTVIDALSWMEVGDKSKSKVIESVYQVTPDIGMIAEIFKEYGSKNLYKHAAPRTGIPVMPMLAQRLKSPTEMIKKMGKVAIEPKFDGLRTLIHYKKGETLKVFTRNLNEISAMFPELSVIGSQLTVDEVVLDCEAVGLDPDTAKMANFQTTMKRRRKHGIGKTSKKIPLRFQVFDVILSGGINMMNEPYIKRREELARVIKPGSLLVVDAYQITSDASQIEHEHKKYLELGLEGVIVKKVDSKYVPGRTGWRWVKMKEIESAQGKLADTVDAVIMGYSSGKGKRAGFGVGQFLVGVRDKDLYKTISKVGTGLSDDEFRKLNKMLSAIGVKEKPKEYIVSKTLEPDFWVVPKVVVELAADEITKSPNYSAGFSLRFPRLARFREDKSAVQATTLKEIKNLYKIS
ncbi:ATP-dependent DNA ligase [Candidatus Microgenomates bacterium]|nr:MAG: ATP-dependent DNA ligase [Candidatus Microgenomates bacterium]